jgi:Protein of unknown function (DUF2934)/Hsp20/alpha crystallin family
MQAQCIHKASRAGEKVGMKVLSAGEQTRCIHEAIARRAYEIFKVRGGAGGHELKDWRQAETELTKPFCGGEMALNGWLWFGTDASIFEEGTIEIWVAPRRLTISGKPRLEQEGAASEENRARFLYRVVELPVEIEPSAVTATFEGPSLEIMLRKAKAVPGREIVAA